MLIWYLARAAGVTAFALLSIATAAGALTSRRTAAVETRVLTQYVHRSAAMAGLAMLALHIVTILADPYAHVGVGGALIPFASGYRPLAVTLGVLGLYALVAVSVTGLARSHFARYDRGVRVWRGIHLASYGAWLSAAWHFWLAGSDTGQWWARAVLVGGVAIVLAGVTVRLSESSATRSAPIRVGGRA